MPKYKSCIAAIACLFVCTSRSPAAESPPGLQTLYSFQSGADGALPIGTLAVQRDGSIAGATYEGGAKGRGTVFTLTPPSPGQTAWSETVISDFPRGRDGREPLGGLARGQGGFAGTATGGNTQSCGTVFRLLDEGKGWVTHALWNFGGYPVGDGCNPGASLLTGPGGIVYGTTAGGGAANAGTVFSLAPPVPGQTAWQESVLFAFTQQSQGAFPYAPLLLGIDGALYGTTFEGGANNEGAVFRLAPPANGQIGWSFSVIWSFSGTDCFNPSRGALVTDPSGALYGTCSSGGRFLVGAAYRLTPPAPGANAWTETNLWDFSGRKDGGEPGTGLTAARDGSFYGTTIFGHGTIFKLLPPEPDRSGRDPASHAGWRLRTLWRFSGPDGDDPESPLVLTRTGELVGSTAAGGSAGEGTIFLLTP